MPEAAVRRSCSKVFMPEAVRLLLLSFLLPGSEQLDPFHNFEPHNIVTVPTVSCMFRDRISKHQFLGLIFSSWREIFYCWPTGPSP